VEEYLPDREVGFYHQTLMDLGATLCLRRQPKCSLCPLMSRCSAWAEGVPEAYPTSKPKKDKPVKQVIMLVLHDGQGQLLLQARPTTGIWGGLWAFPEFKSQSDAQQWAAERLGDRTLVSRKWPQRRHTFTHFHLDILPLEICWKAPADCVMDGDQFVWYNTRSPVPLGLAAPVKQLIDVLLQQEVKNEPSGSVCKTK